MYNLDDAMLQNLRKLDEHMKSLNIAFYQLPCTVKGVFFSFFFVCVCVWFFEKMLRYYRQRWAHVIQQPQFWTWIWVERGK